jgi:hypothetical protein
MSVNLSPWQISNVASTTLGGTGISALSQNSINTISLSNLNGYSNQSINLGDLEFAFNDNVKKYEIFEVSQDLLALSTCWYRLRKEQKASNIGKLIDGTLFNNIIDEDRKFADIIRDHYCKKVLIWKLKNNRLTSFREDLAEFINTDGKRFKEKMMPLAYRLPEFYEYDIEFEKILFDHNREVKHDNTVDRSVKNLTFVKTLKVNSKKFKRNEFWFSDEFNNLVSINIESHNPLLSLLTKTVSKGLKLNALYRKSTRDGFEFFKATGNLQFL